MIIACTACTATLSPVGKVGICLGKTRTFFCRVSRNDSLSRLEWRIEFQNSRSVPSIIHEYSTSDPVGHHTRDERNGISFTSNITSISPVSIESLMSVTLNDANGTDVLNNATVSCGQGVNTKAVLRAVKGILTQ